MSSQATTLLASTHGSSAQIGILGAQNSVRLVMVTSWISLETALTSWRVTPSRRKAGQMGLNLRDTGALDLPTCSQVLDGRCHFLLFLWPCNAAAISSRRNGCVFIFSWSTFNECESRSSACPMITINCFGYVRRPQTRDLMFQRRRRTWMS